MNSDQHHPQVDPISADHPNGVPQPESATRARTNIRWLALALLAAIPYLLYGHTLHFDPVLDDEAYVLHNPLLKNADNFSYPWHFRSFAMSGNDLGQSGDMALNFITRPLTYFTFYLNLTSHDTSLAGFRIINILIHAANGFLLFFLLEKLLGKDLKSTISAALATLLFAVHPMATESVTYITQRFESLSTLFCLAAVLSYSFFKSTRTTGKAGVWLGISLISTLASMLSKETGFVIPLLILALEYFHYQSPIKKSLKLACGHLLLMPILPFLIIATDYAQTGTAPTFDSLFNITNHGEKGHTSYEYLLTQVSAWLTYLRLWLLPIGQNFDHDYPKITALFQPAFIKALAGVLCLSLLVWITHRRTQGKTALITLGAFWFILSLTPSSSFFALPDLFAEHRSYFPAIGLFLGVAALLRHLLRQERIIRWKMPVIVIYPVLLLTLSLATLLRNETLRTRENIWTDSLAKGTNTARVWKGLGIANHEQGRPKKAVQCFQKAVEVNPTDLESWFNLNTAYLKMNMNQEALKSTAKSLDIFGGNSLLLHHRALALTNAGLADEGCKIWQFILQHLPSNRSANLGLGEVFAKSGRYAEALIHLLEAEKTGPLPDNMKEVKKILQSQLSTMR